MVSPLAKHVLAALALGLAIAALPSCTHSTGDADHQQSTALSAEDCEKTKPWFKCTMSANGFECGQNQPPVSEDGQGAGPSWVSACTAASAQLAAKQVADQCHKWVPSKPKFEVEETTRINRAACKKLTLAQGSVNLSSGDKFLKTPSGITVLPALPGVRSINMVPAYP